MDNSVIFYRSKKKNRQKQKLRSRQKIVLYIWSVTCITLNESIKRVSISKVIPDFQS